MRRLIAWCVPLSAFWSWKDQIAVFYDRAWVHVRPEERNHYKNVYGVNYR